MYFTVKHVTKSGDHQFWQTDCVHCSPRNANPAADYDRDVYFYTGPSNLRIEINDGEVYVMNDHGQTVQRYRLRLSENAPAGSGNEASPLGAATLDARR